ncbi:MAG: chorismate mutase [Solobacterium sp.]|jgi:chorismate mutase/prephenate dehydratase|nr:chorismate mutase [Solobacterium sp.]MCH4222880.1 chorismate mutase [Solobacterium sp.]MCH4266225.1 chorismate mutase [Solobacterium sp.]
MTALDESRKRINEIDSELAALFEERMHTVRQIAEYKRDHGLQVFDPSREQDNIQRNSEKLKDQSLKPYFSDWYQDTMDVSKQYQRDLLKEEEK